MTTNGNNLTNPDLWFRLLYMILFGVLSWVARLAVLVIALLQFLLVLFTGNGNANLRCAGEGIARWTEQAYRFLTFSSDEKPYPFQDWPAPVCETVTPSATPAEAPVPTAVPAAGTESSVQAAAEGSAEGAAESPAAAGAKGSQADVSDSEKPKTD